MADLDPLIRFRKYGVEEKQRLLAQLFREMQELEAQKSQIEEQMDTETAMAEELGQAETLAYLGRYLEGARLKLRGIEAAINKMEARIALAQEDMRAAFAEMKKIEIVDRNRQEREDAELKAKETRELDDIAIDQYRRNLVEESSN
ncbi:MAG: hypothetical protein H6868_05155 [Rhodospirillales bacterium]|nr:hypothetical protein [Rhodospirillales bacterium]